jgi:hypothetical protein
MALIIPSYSLHPTKIILYNQVLEKKHHRGEYGKAVDNFVDNSRNNKLSAQTKTKITLAIEYLNYLSKEQTQYHKHTNKSITFRLTFITLTLPSKQIHDDKEIKNQLLNQLLVELRKYYNVNHYIWRAEYQKNGNIHFHLICNKFIPYDELVNRWNRIVNKLGYVNRYREIMKERYKNGFQPTDNKNDKRDIKQQFESYKKAVKNDWNQPNSTDIHSLRNVLNAVAYLAKYMIKETDTNITKGKLWDCSESLSNLKGSRGEVDTKIYNEIEKLKKLGKVHIYSSDYYSIIYFDTTLLQTLKLTILEKCLFKYLLEKFNYNSQLKTYI